MSVEGEKKHNLMTTFLHFHLLVNIPWVTSSIRQVGRFVTQCKKESIKYRWIFSHTWSSLTFPHINFFGLSCQNKLISTYGANNQCDVRTRIRPMEMLFYENLLKLNIILFSLQLRDQLLGSCAIKYFGATREQWRQLDLLLACFCFASHADLSSTALSLTHAFSNYLIHKGHHNS